VSNKNGILQSVAITSNGCLIDREVLSWLGWKISRFPIGPRQASVLERGLIILGGEASL
jgi:hypothetical protein